MKPVSYLICKSECFNEILFFSYHQRTRESASEESDHSAENESDSERKARVTRSTAGELSVDSLYMYGSFH